MKIKKSKKKPLSFVIPCLNERGTLPGVLAAINKLKKGAFKDRACEMVVSDNGSSDGSQLVARRNGARVVHCRQRGYGAALKFGVAAAKHGTVIFADADGTYDFLETPRLVEAFEKEKGRDLVIGSRLRGDIKPGAMPWSHRRLGTPVLTALINFLYGRPGGFRFTDCNSGFRCFSKQAHASWKLHSDGMEYASEMLVAAMRMNSRIAEVPISLSPDKRGREPHLKRWRDGMRHFIQIFSGAPGFFEWAGLGLAGLSWAVLAAGYAFGMVQLGPVYVLGPHTGLFAMLLGSVGLSVWAAGLLMSARDPLPAAWSYRVILGLGEEQLFWGSLAGLAFCTLLLGAIVAAWTMRGFAHINLERETLIAVALATQMLLFIFNAFTGHVLKRVARRA